MKEKKSLSKIIFYMAFYILSFIFFNILISTLLFIFHISIQPFYMIISAVLSIILNTYLLKKNKLFNIKNIIYTIVIPIFIISLITFISSKFYDYTYDGNSYHKATTIMLSEGWNPVYEDMLEFDLKDGNTIYSSPGSLGYLWGTHYAKANHIYSANLYSLTGRIESGKSLTSISVIMMFLFIVSILLEYKKSKIFSLFFGIVAISCPLVSAQYLTNYIDASLYIFLFLTILYFFIAEQKFKLISQKEKYLYFIMVLTIIINIKFSSFGYAGIFCLGYYIWYIIRLIKKDITKKQFKDFTITAIIAVIVGVFIVGLSVYPKNFVEKGHPFHPLYGEDKVDIMTGNTPSYFNDKTNVEKFLISLFSKSENISQASTKKPEIKIPLTFTKEEINNLASADLRISGYGIFFSGILILGILSLIINGKKIYTKNKKMFILCIIPLTITIVMIICLNESWWARYVPQLYYFVLISLLFLEANNNTFNRIILIILFTLLLINNAISFKVNTGFSYNYTKKLNTTLQTIKDNNSKDECKIELYTLSHPGISYIMMERLDEYKYEFANCIDSECNPENYNYNIHNRLGWRCLDE